VNQKLITAQKRKDRVNMGLSASLFNQLLQQFPKPDYQRLVNQNRAESKAKGFACWMQFVSMLLCQVARADSLREISTGLRPPLRCGQRRRQEIHLKQRGFLS